MFKLTSFAMEALGTSARVYRPFAFSATGARALILVFVADEAMRHVTRAVFVIASAPLSVVRTFINRFVPATHVPFAKGARLTVQFIIVKFFDAL
jgi:hypothetical protein